MLHDSFRKVPEQESKRCCLCGEVAGLGGPQGRKHLGCAPQLLSRVHSLPRASPRPQCRKNHRVPTWTDKEGAVVHIREQHGGRAWTLQNGTRNPDTRARGHPFVLQVLQQHLIKLVHTAHGYVSYYRPYRTLQSKRRSFGLILNKHRRLVLGTRKTVKTAQCLAVLMT